MATKTSGKELKTFYNDTTFWPTDTAKGNTWHEDEVITVNGAIHGEYGDIAAIPDDAVVTISGGIVFSDQWEDEKAPSFETFFKRWRKVQDVSFITVEVRKEYVEKFKELMKDLEIKIS